MTKKQIDRTVNWLKKLIKSNHDPKINKEMTQLMLEDFKDQLTQQNQKKIDSKPGK